MEPTVIIANDLNELWFESIKACFNPRYAKKFVVGKGSFEGQYRYQLHSYTGMITYPGTRPLAPILPGGMVATTTDEYIEKYFCENIMSPEKAVNEEYSYCEFIYPHLDSIIELLYNHPNTNQAVINIGEPFWFEVQVSNDRTNTFKYPKKYENPPCLRCIAWQYDDLKLSIHVFFRSWDICNGLPTNLGGMQLLNEYVCQETGYDEGPMFVYSSGAHVYETSKPMVEQRLGKKFEW